MDSWANLSRFSAGSKAYQICWVCTEIPPLLGTRGVRVGVPNDAEQYTDVILRNPVNLGELLVHQVATLASRQVKIAIQKHLAHPDTLIQGEEGAYLLIGRFPNWLGKE